MTPDISPFDKKPNFNPSFVAPESPITLEKVEDYLDVVGKVRDDVMTFLAESGVKKHWMKGKMQKTRQLVFNGSVFLQVNLTKNEKLPYEINILTAFGELPIVRMRSMPYHEMFDTLYKKHKLSIHSCLDSLIKRWRGIAFFSEAILQTDPDFSYPEEILTYVKKQEFLVKKGKLIRSL